MNLIPFHSIMFLEHKINMYIPLKITCYIDIYHMHIQEDIHNIKDGEPQSSINMHNHIMYHNIQHIAFGVHYSKYIWHAHIMLQKKQK